ncbi:type I secretion system permease/ATPase [Roseibium sp. RKSG952]|uniref:type I secretion system permease/ATPase n=1 Tax=Roseibium sp. RKSG952 TaxID=2529384 RepID=UPI0012BBB9E6|nr:type I secretion system permease/ATPase [Roseibium sp. RKSG952]MTH95151.1 type I secretion system permease/ATPase [Roseibium sp. RKSG952]
MTKKNTLSKAIKRYRSYLLSVAFVSFCVNILLFTTPLFLMQVYDRVLASRNEFTLLMLVLVSLLLLAILGGMEFLRSNMMVRMGVQFDTIVAQPTFRKVFSNALRPSSPGGRQALDDIEKLRGFLTGNGLTTFLDVPWVPLFLAATFLFHPLLGLVATGGAIVIFALALYNETATRKLIAEAGETAQTASHIASVTFRNAEVIKALGMERVMSEKWREKHDHVVDRHVLASGRSARALSISRFVRLALQVLMLATGAYLVIENQVTAGIMFASSMMMGRALAPVEQSVSNWKQFIVARGAYLRLKTVLDGGTDPLEHIDLPDPKGAVSVDKLIYMLPGSDRPVLENVAFSIAPGVVLAIIGASGAGKSSLVRHLVGVCWPTRGAVRLDGAELSHWDPVKLGPFIGYLPQDVEVFSGTISENISRYQPDRDEDVVRAAKRAGVHDMILGLPKGYATDVGQGGWRLSGGQLQRIGLARALFGNPKLLVLDEPDASLDSTGEEALVNALQQMKADGTTIIFVSHKANMLRISDKVLVLESGKVRAFGPTNEVLKSGMVSAGGAPGGRTDKSSQGTSGAQPHRIVSTSARAPVEQTDQLAVAAASARRQEPD